jgi:hypothetical protein
MIRKSNFNKLPVKLMIRNNRKSGSITVEAAFIMPILVFAISALIYLAFYLHDVSMIQAVLDKTLHKEGVSVKHDADIITGEISYEDINNRGVFYLIFGDTSGEERELQDYLQQELSQSLFLTRITVINTEVRKFDLNISIEAETIIAIPFFQNLFNQYSKTLIKGDYPVHDPAETIRRIEVILDTGSSIKGVDELKEKLEDFFGS